MGPRTAMIAKRIARMCRSTVKVLARVPQGRHRAASTWLSLTPFVAPTVQPTQTAAMPIVRRLRWNAKENARVPQERRRAASARLSLTPSVVPMAQPTQIAAMPVVKRLRWTVEENAPVPQGRRRAVSARMSLTLSVVPTAQPTQVAAMPIVRMPRWTAKENARVPMMMMMMTLLRTGSAIVGEERGQSVPRMEERFATDAWQTAKELRLTARVGARALPALAQKYSSPSVEEMGRLTRTDARQNARESGSGVTASVLAGGMAEVEMM